jgi:hypothetical protein
VIRAIRTATRCHARASGPPPPGSGRNHVVYTHLEETVPVCPGVLSRRDTRDGISPRYAASLQWCLVVWSRVARSPARVSSLAARQSRPVAASLALVPYPPLPRSPPLKPNPLASSQPQRRHPDWIRGLLQTIPERRWAPESAPNSARLLRCSRNRSGEGPETAPIPDPTEPPQ